MSCPHMVKAMWMKIPTVLLSGLEFTRSWQEEVPQSTGKTPAVGKKSVPQVNGTKTAVGWQNVRSRLEKISNEPLLFL